MDTTKVRWPDAHAPEGASIYAANHAPDHADPELIWAWLIRPDQWHRFYGNAKLIATARAPGRSSGSASLLLDHVRALVTTEVTEFEPLRRLAWAGRARNRVPRVATRRRRSPMGNRDQGDRARVPADAGPAVAEAGDAAPAPAVDRAAHSPCREWGKAADPLSAGARHSNPSWLI